MSASSASYLQRDLGDGQSTRLQRPIPNLHALLIGIDTYASVANLSGASKDADSLEKFLLSDLSVPAPQITNLRNAQATRSGILDELDKLRQNPDIVPFDPIVIYYAGHGCEVDTLSAHRDSYKGKTQCLVPWDAGTRDADGNSLPPIPDYTIAALLYAIAAEKGNNIVSSRLANRVEPLAEASFRLKTVIFDCCHSASSTRGIQQMAYRGARPQPNADLSKWTVGHDSTSGAYRARRLEPEDLPPLTRDIDKSILRELAPIQSNLNVTPPGSQHVTPDQTQSGFRRFGRSHVLLAACGHAEIAFESTASDNGYFTTALLQRLRSSQLHKLTYKACFEDFPRLLTPRNQNPVCEGDDTGRLFFSATAVQARRAFVPIQQVAGRYVMKAGIAQGVIPGSMYGIYEDDVFGEEQQPGQRHSPELPTLCATFTANPCMEQDRYPCQSWCDLHNNSGVPNHPRAKLLTRGGSHTFEVYLTDGFHAEMHAASVLRADQGIIQAESPEKSKVILGIDQEGGRMTLESTGFAGTPLHECDADLARAQSILFSMAQWDWHLYREPTGNAKPKKVLAQLQILRLGESGPTPVPFENGVATLTASPQNVYGLRLKSLSNRRLYAYLFYFSTTSQSIKPLFLSIYGSGRVDAPLDANGELTIGYGNDDMISGPLSFRPTHDIGYFKLFLTTSPGDFDSMTQPSPFVVPNGMSTMSLMNGNKYSDGIEIMEPSLVGHNRASQRTLPADSSVSLNKAGTEISNPNVDGGANQTTNAATYQNWDHNKTSLKSPVGYGWAPRMISSAEVSDRLDKQEIWDAVTLKVILRGANC